MWMLPLYLHVNQNPIMMIYIMILWGQKLGDRAKLKENLVRVYMFEVIIMNLAQIVCLDDF